MDCPMVKVGPTVSLVVPPDVFSFKGTSTFLGVKIVDMFVVGEGVGKLLWIDPFLRIEVTPPMSGSWGVDGFVDPKGEKVTFSFDLRTEVFVKLCVDKLLRCKVEGVVG